MAIRIIDIGIEGNDGTGDSIRTSFDKVNTNFQELYAVFGQGGQIRFTDLSDVLIPNAVNGVPPLYNNPNAVLIVDESGTKVTLKPIAAKTNLIYIKYTNLSGGTFLQDQIITGSVSHASGKIIIAQSSNNAIYCELTSSVNFAVDDTILSPLGVNATVTSVDEGIVSDTATRLNTDPFPALMSPLNATGNLIGNVASPTTELVNSFNNWYGTSATLDKFVAPISFNDDRYMLKNGDTLTGELYLNDHPLPLEGFGSPTNDPEDFQTVTRFYVDNDPTNYSHTNLYVSTSGSDNQRFTVFGREGKSWKHAFSTISQACRYAEYLVDIIGNTVLNIYVEAGNYQEHFPIKVSQNVKLYGENVTVSPVSGVSTSPWLTIQFYRDLTFNGLTIADNTFGYHYLTNSADITSTAKDNNLIDAFLLCNNSEITGINITGHNAFHSVLYPSAINSVPKVSNYSFTGGAGSSTFYGGAYIDGFFSNQITNITKVSNNTLTATSCKIKPIAPGYFIDAGTTYLIDSVTPILSAHNRAATLIFKNLDFILDEMKHRFIVSYTAHDYIKWNNLFRDLVVSIYHDVQYGSNNHSTSVAYSYVRNTLLSTWTSEHTDLVTCVELIGTILQDIVSNNVYNGLTSLSQTIESPDDASAVSVITSLITEVTGIINKTFSGSVIYPTYTISLNASTPVTGAITSATLIASIASMYVSSANITAPHGYGVVGNNLAIVGLDNVTTTANTGVYANNGARVESIHGKSVEDTIGLIAAGVNPIEIPNVITLSDNMIQIAKVYKTGAHASDNMSGESIIYVYDHTYVPYNFSFVEINHGNAIGIKTYPVQNVSLNDNVLTVYFNQPDTNKLAADLINDQSVIFRSGTHLKFNGVNDNIPTRPSTALTYESETLGNYVYRALGFSSIDPIGNSLPSNTYVITTDNAYRYPSLIIDLSHTTGGFGGTVGDTKIAISQLTDQTVIDRFNSGKTIFGWNDTIHTISAYTYDQIDGYAYVTFSPGLTSTVDPSTNATLMLNAPPIIPVGLSNSNVSGTIVVGISNIVASSHRFTNVPTHISDISRGRVFYEATDQNGTFNVGSYFSVDQGTGIVNISSAVILTNVYGLQFYRGVTVSEFSIDDSFSTMEIDSVPTMYATGKYIDRRLGIDKYGAVLPSGNLIGTGFLDREGLNSATGNLNLGGFRYTNAGIPVNSTDLASKLYVDLKSGQVSKAPALPTDGYAINNITLSVDFHTATITTSVNHNIPSNKTITISGVTGGTGHSLNGDWVVQSIGSNTLTVYSSDVFAGTYIGGNVYSTGTSSYNSSTFTVSPNGFVDLADSNSTTSGVTLSKIRYIGADQYFGRPKLPNVSGAPTLVSSSQIVADGGAVLGSAFTTPGVMYASTPNTQLLIGTGSSWTGSGGVQVTSLYITVNPTNLSGNGVVVPGVAVSGSGIPLNSTVSTWDPFTNSLLISWPVSQVITTASNVTLTFTAISTVYNTLPISTTGAANSLVKLGTSGEINAHQLKLDNFLVADIASSSTLELFTPGSSASPFFTASGSTPATTTTTISGNVGISGDLNSLSDSRFKSNVSTIDDALAKVLNLRGVYYTKTFTSASRKVGVIAQEVLAVIPEAVVEQEVDGIQCYGVEYGNLVGVLIEAIKELKLEIDTLKKELGK